MPYFHLNEIAATEPFPGFHSRFVHSRHMTVAHFQIEAGSVLPEHAHSQEQVVTVLEGMFVLSIDGEIRVLGPDSAAVVPSCATHSGRALTDCRIIDVFHPVREDHGMQIREDHEVQMRTK